MKNYIIHFIRHGRTIGNEMRTYVGNTESPLSEGGKEELSELKKKYGYPEAETVFVSSLGRCIETAKIIYPDGDFIISDDIREMSFGEFEGKLPEELAGSESYKLWLKDSANNTPKGGENPGEFIARCCRGFEDSLLYMMKNGVTEAAIVTHGGVIMNLLAAYGLPRREMLDWLVANGHGYSVRVTPTLFHSGKVFEVESMLPLGVQTVGNKETRRVFNL